MVNLIQAYWEANLSKNHFLLLFFILVGAILGGIIGEAFSGFVPLLTYGKSIGLNPTTLDLSIIKVTFGFSMKLNLAGIIGIVIALFIYKRL